VFRRYQIVDRFKLLQLKHYYHPESLTEAERLEFEHAPWFLRAGRWFRRFIYNPTRRFRRGVLPPTDAPDRT
jgi:hypothetical protein